MTHEQWTQDSSAVYRQLAKIAVPSRAEQIATLLMLMPFQRDSRVRVVELGAGEGFLAHAILQIFNYATLLALDGEETMRAAARDRLIPVAMQAEVEPFDLYSTDWYHRLEGADCVVSSLCIHHLNDAEKQRLFKEIYERLSPNGALLIADLVQPARAEARELFAATWDRSAKQQSEARTSKSELYDQFVAEHWNYYRFPDPFDKPSRLFEQLIWLKEAGFSVVDCFWMQAGHAIYGGYKQPAQDLTFSGVPFDEAYAMARIVLGAAG